jgi:hypothetical protein
MERFKPAFCRTLRPGSSTVPAADAVMFRTFNASKWHVAVKWRRRYWKNPSGLHPI